MFVKNFTVKNREKSNIMTKLSLILLVPSFMTYFKYMTVLAFPSTVTYSNKLFYI
jgi:hypothetical protein